MSAPRPANLAQTQEDVRSILFGCGAVLFGLILALVMLGVLIGRSL